MSERNPTPADAARIISEHGSMTGEQLYEALRQEFPDAGIATTALAAAQAQREGLVHTQITSRDGGHENILLSAPITPSEEIS